MDANTKSKGPVASTVITAAAILEHIAEKGKAYPRELAAGLQLNRSTVHRMLFTLEMLNYVGKLPDGAYRLTFHLFEIGNSVPHSHNLIDTARRGLLQLSDETGLTVNHGILYEDQVLYVDKASPATYLQLDRSVGGSEPLHCTSLGKTLLAFHEEPLRDEIISRLSLNAYTENTITDETALREELKLIRERGYAVDHQEFSMEIRCVAAPVFSRGNRVFSGISLSGPVDRLQTDFIVDLLPRLLETAAEISENMLTATQCCPDGVSTAPSL